MTELPLDSILSHPFAWPGGYERFLVTDDGGCICHKCAKAEKELIKNATPGDGWHAVGIGCAAEIDGPSHCDHCHHAIVECWQCEDDACRGCTE